MELITKLDAVDYVLEKCALPEEVKEKMLAIQHGLLKDKNRVSKTAIARKANAERVFAILTVDVPMSIKEIQARDEVLASYNPQRVASAITLLVNEERVDRVQTKEGVRYSLRQI